MGSDPDVNEALKWYNLAFKQKNLIAIRSIGEIYSNELSSFPGASFTSEQAFSLANKLEELDNAQSKLDQSKASFEELKNNSIKNLEKN